MNHKVKKILGELKNCVEGAEVEYVNILAENYREYASVVLTLNYYILYETGYDEKNYNTPELLGYINDVNAIIRKYIVNNENVDEGVIKNINDIRNKIIYKLDLLLNYTAKLYIYEYILNRLEYNFEEPIENAKLVVNDENFAKQVIDYIFSNNDSVVINGKIREVIGQLPVRMTKNKFFDLVRDALSIYKDGKVEGLDTFLDKIRSAATLTHEDEDDEYSLLAETLEFYDSIDFKNIDQETFEKAQGKYREINQFIRVYTDFLSDLQRCVNMTYTILLTKQIQNNNEECKLDEVRSDILGHICDCFSSEYNDEIDDDITSKLVYVEGIQEKSHAICMQLEQAIDEDVLEAYVSKNSDNCLEENIIRFKKCEQLVSTSIFIDIDQDKQDVKDMDVDDELLETKTEELLNDMKELFKTKDRMYTRAVMANVLSELPVFFVNMNEVVEYVNTQISSCTNQNEKMACYAILSDIMADDDVKWNFNME